MEKIEERIAKLLSLAQNNDNVNEAASAMAMVERLLAEHNLSLSGIIDKIDGTVNISVEEHGTFHKGVSGKHIPEWMAYLVHCVTCAYPIKVIYLRSYQGLTVRFLGVAPDANIAKSMYDYLYKTMFRGWAARPEEVTCKPAFFKGFAQSLYERIYDMVNERDKNLGAIMLAKNKIVKEHIREAFPRLGKAKFATVKRTSAEIEISYFNGIVAGKHADVAFDTKEKRAVHA